MKPNSTILFYLTPLTSSSMSSFHEPKPNLSKDIDVDKVSNTFICNPYNPNNIEITSDDVKAILTKFNLPPFVHNLDLYKRVFVHPSYLKRPQYENEKNNVVMVPKPDNCLPLKTKSYQRLEFRGDGILNGVCKSYLYRRFPKEDEGFMTSKQIALTKNTYIGQLAYKMGLHKWLILSKKHEEIGSRTNVKILACLFEALIGAIILDFDKITVPVSDELARTFDTHQLPIGYQFADKFIINVFETYTDWDALLNNNDNYKTLLQTLFQQEFKVLPVYRELEYDDANETYTMGVFCVIHDENPDYENAMRPYTITEIHERILNDGQIVMFCGQGTHKNKKRAEQFACCEYLKFIGHV